MQKLKQTMILSGNGNEVATLSIEKKLNGTFGTIKAYNLRENDNLVLGLSIDDKIIKQNISLNANDTYTFKLKDVGSIDSVSGVLLSKKDTKYEPVIWCKKQCKYDEILAEFNDVYTSSNTEVKKVVVSSVDEDKSDLFESSDDEVENLIDEAIGEEDIENATEEDVDNIEETEPIDNVEAEDIYRDAIDEESVDNIFSEENSKLSDFKGNEFFELISDQVDDLFDNYPRVDELEELISNSKWVKIDFENNGNEYVLGLIYDGFDLKYICYGVPGKYGSTPPKQLGECQWLPLDPADPVDGYWVIYQDANTGDKVDII